MRTLRSHMLSLALIAGLGTTIVYADQPKKTDGNGSANQSKITSSAGGNGAGQVNGGSGSPIKSSSITGQNGQRQTDQKSVLQGQQLDQGRKIDNKILQNQNQNQNLDKNKSIDSSKLTDPAKRLDGTSKAKIEQGSKTADQGARKIDLGKKTDLKINPSKLNVIDKTKLDSAQLGQLKNPGLKLGNQVKVDAEQLNKIKPVIDLNKIKAKDVVSAKPTQKFDIKPISMDKLHIPANAAKVDLLSAKMKLDTKSMILNNPAKVGGVNYFKTHALKCATGWCYPGAHHCHWHHCIWDPCFSCHYYYCPSASCYFYWCEAELCYYPCYWFVEHHGCHYPWWMCGGFSGYGYTGGVSIDIHIGL